MLFNSLTFVVFFAIVVALHQARWSWRQKKINLLIASYLFYAAWNPPFVILLWISTLVDWHIAKAIFAEENTRKRRLLLAVSVLVNLGILGFFKYGEFLLDNWLALLATFGLAYEPPTWSIVLPSAYRSTRFRRWPIHWTSTYGARRRVNRSSISRCS